MKEFDGKTAVITGGASGIGRAIAERCVKEGINIVLADIEEQALTNAKAELETTGASIIAVKTDVSKAEDIEALADKTIETFGEVHLLFNNAGVGCPGSIWEHTVNDWKWVLGVNLWGVIHGVRVFTPLMLEQNTECHIVNSASIAGLKYNTFMGPYSVSKFGIVSLSESLYLELMELDSKVKVSVLCPGFVNTRMGDSVRNRPVGLMDPVGSVSAKGLEKMRSLMSMANAGMSSEKVAEMVFQAINEERFYIITHEDSFDDIENRMNCILQERNPTLL